MYVQQHRVSPRVIAVFSFFFYYQLKEPELIRLLHLTIPPCLITLLLGTVRSIRALLRDYSAEN